VLKNRFKKRQIAFKEQLPVIHIYCEGKNTEPDYFNFFRVKTAKIKSVGVGDNTLSLVGKAIECIKKESFDPKLDQKWCVFDKDDFDAQRFDNAVAKATSNGFGVAWSNQSFEYWFLLHFNDHQGGTLHRDILKEKINLNIPDVKARYNGDGSKHVTGQFFQELSATDPATGVPRQELVIKRAARLHATKREDPPSGSESCTTVYKLVEILNRYRDS